jgi:Lamin Tail Domain
MKSRRRNLLGALGLACAAAIAAGGVLAVGGGAATTADDSIHACRHPNGGWVRIIASGDSCRSREQSLTWGAVPSGTGITKLSDLEGIACTTDAGGAGKVSLDSAGDDTVLFRCVAGGGGPPPGAPKLVINEVDYDQVGTDGDGFVEIKNTGTTAATLTGISLVLVDGADGEEYRRVALTGTLAAGGYAVVDVDPQNGAPDGLAIVDTASGGLIDALSYEGAITSAKIGTQTYSLVEGTVLPATTADSNAVAGSLIRNPDGRDTGNAASDWAFTTTLTKGAANVLTAAH